MRVITASAIGILCLATTVASAQNAGPKPGALPDWSGAWVMQGPTVFDAATVQPKNGRAGEPGVRSSRRTTPSTKRSTKRTSSS